ncbi:maleylacetate reductase [Salisediminibacterium halotolerans]|uniref:Alcohol dehydrogenase n=1 Tax=Salisediminibacterium halotolerans TaxID=517425 RepID=A0A1H9SZM3_9BACI|nr:maleylacetate reductase [Salisediminibacterium haloalkalitolerans]SER90331.1 hypothetical protein SAMN05444126_10879 [Salisediminibacterium haloalkalitolerans]
MESFLYESLANRVVFGEGKALNTVKEEVEQLEGKKALVISTRERESSANEIAKHKNR